MELGDAVKAVTDTLGIEQCEACKRRQQWLNELGQKMKFIVFGGVDAVQEEQVGEGERKEQGASEEVGETR